MHLRSTQNFKYFWLGITFHLLEARYNPWWISHTEAEAVRAARRRDQVLTSAPALWALVVIIALTLPVVLSCGMSQTGSGYSMAPPARGYETTGPYSPPSPPGASGGYSSVPYSSPSTTGPHAPAPSSPGYEQPSDQRDTCRENGPAPKAPY